MRPTRSKTLNRPSHLNSPLTDTHQAGLPGLLDSTAASLSPDSKAGLLVT